MPTTDDFDRYQFEPDDSSDSVSLPDEDAEQSALNEFYDAAHLPAPLEPIVLTLDLGVGIDWDAAQRAVDSVDADDLDYIFFALGISEDAEGGVDAALNAARELLREELARFADAVNDPDSDELTLVSAADGSLALCAPAPEDNQLDPDGVYGALLRLGLMYVTDAAGLRRGGAPSVADTGESSPAGMPARSRRSVQPRPRGRCERPRIARRRRWAA